ncbi:MAG TPA: T9SS type A sorting domain-containing protein [Bacteroidia bacterium]|nr:T9SS type A sorting domain-containing protein [Bacteroidia bacterium]
MNTLRICLLGLYCILFWTAVPAQSVFNSCPGVTITASTSSGMSGQPDCASISAVLLPGGWTSTSAAGFVRYNWPAPVSSVRIEFFSVNTNDYATISTNTGGALFVTSVGGCAPVSGVVVGPYTGPTAFGTTAFNVSSTIPFTQLNFINTGGQSGWVCDCPVMVILAVELNYFQAHYDDDRGHVGLAWQTATETNSDHFVVERSVDGNEWEAIGKVAAAGQSSHALNYSFEDRLPISGKSMYRLQQVDQDGSYRLSGAESVFVDDYLKVYPSLADQLVHIGGITEAGQVELFDKLGKSHVCTGTREASGLVIDVSALEGGLYIVRIADAGTVVSRKIWVRH